MIKNICKVSIYMYVNMYVNTSIKHCLHDREVSDAAAAAAATARFLPMAAHGGRKAPSTKFHFMPLAKLVCNDSNICVTLNL